MSVLFRKTIYRAGYALGQAHLLRQATNRDVKSLLESAAGDLQSCELKAIADILKSYANNWRNTSDKAINDQMEAVKSATLQSKPKGYHSFCTAVNFGWAFIAAEGKDVKDVKYVIGCLNNATDHMGIVNPQQKATIADMIKLVNGKIMALDVPRRAIELPQYKNSIQNLKTQLVQFL